MKKKIGIVGFGEMGKRHALEFREATRGKIEIAGVVEPDDKMYRRGCEWNNTEKIPRFETIPELLRQAAPDGLIIASPNSTHWDSLRQLAGCPIPVLLEKPLDVSLDKIAEIVRFSENYPAPIMVDHVMRYAPIIRKGRELIEQGRLGKICSFQFSQRTDIGMFHTFRRTQSGGGGHIIEKATHDLDVLLYLTAAQPESVSMISEQQVVGGDKPDDLACPECPEAIDCRHAWLGETKPGKVKDIATSDKLCVYARSVDVPDNETCMIKLSGGIFGTYSHTYFGYIPGRSRIYEIIGTDGAMVITLSKEKFYTGEIKFFPFDNHGTQEVFDFEYFNKIHYYGGPFAARHFYNLMCGMENTPFTTVKQAFIAEALGFAAMKSASENSRFVTITEIIPPDFKKLIAEGR